VHQHFPFSAVVGADDLALALVLTAVSPDVGGVLVRGEKGTAKSTAVRALTSLLPEVRDDPNIYPTPEVFGRLFITTAASPQALGGSLFVAEPGVSGPPARPFTV